MNLSTTERARLKTLRPDLVRVVERAAKITKIRFRVMETTRTLSQQKKNIANGVSWTLKSKHLPDRQGFARAVDLVTIVDGKPSWSWPPYKPLAKTIFQAAKDVGVVVRWGGTWSTKYSEQLARNADGPHWEVS